MRRPVLNLNYGAFERTGKGNARLFYLCSRRTMMNTVLEKVSDGRKRYYGRGLLVGVVLYSFIAKQQENEDPDLFV